MKNISYNSQKKGFVLSLILWITAAMMLLSLLFIRMGKEESTIYKKLHNKLLLTLTTQSLLEEISFYATTGKFYTTSMKNNLENFPKSIEIDAREYNITQNGFQCNYSILDNSALFNLRFLPATTAAQQTISIIAGKKYMFGDIYLDWIDKDDLTRINGAEESDYSLNNYQYKPANYVSFQNKDAIYLLKDFDKLDKNSTNQILKYFTTYGTVPINIMLVDKIELKAMFPGIEDEDIKRLLYLRKNKPQQYIKSFKNSSMVPDSYSTVASKVLTISITCHKNDIKSNLKATIDTRATNSKSLSINQIYK